MERHGASDSSVSEPISQAKAQLTTEQQIMEELIVEHTDVPVQEWSLNDVGT